MATIATTSGPGYNPAVPIRTRTRVPDESVFTTKQRWRRASILASTRSLVIDQGCDHVTMRGIADLSGQAVGTIYNLVGNRDEAIAEAISEYTLHVGRMSCPRPDDPLSLIRLIDFWMQSTRATPELCRQLHLLYFTKSRDIYYRFQELQLKQLGRFLRQQQRHNIISPDVEADVVAEHMLLVTCGLHQRWADRPYSLDRLHRDLRESLVSLTIDKFDSAYRALLRETNFDLSIRWPTVAAG